MASGRTSTTLPIWRTAQIADRAFDGLGMMRHRARRFSESADWFRRAAEVDEQSEKAPYNLACALSRLGDPGSEQALREAVARGRPNVMAKALEDPDLASVRGAPWFQQLLTKTQRPAQRSSLD